MSDKQREDHVQANYWNGFLTRVEAQKVNDETAQVLMGQGQALTKMDIVLSFMAEKLDVTREQIETWYKAKLEAASKSSLEVAVEKAEADKLVVEA